MQYKKIFSWVSSRVAMYTHTHTHVYKHTHTHTNVPTHPRRWTQSIIAAKWMLNHENVILDHLRHEISGDLLALGKVGDVAASLLVHPDHVVTRLKYRQGERLRLRVSESVIEIERERVRAAYIAIHANTHTLTQIAHNFEYRSTTHVHAQHREQPHRWC